MRSNNYCKRRLTAAGFSREIAIRAAILAACLSLPLLWAQGNQYLTAQAPKLAVKRGTSTETKIAVSVQSGFHVNSNTPSDDYLIPLKLTWETGAALEPDGPTVFPKPRLEKYEFSEKQLSVYTGDFDLIAKFKVAPSAAQGPGILIGKLRYQACNTNSCFPPKTAEVKLSYDVH